MEHCQPEGEKLLVDSPYGAGIRWEGEAQVDGRLWPAGDGQTLWIPRGRHTIQPATRRPAMRLLDLTGELVSAASLEGGLEFTYQSSARAFAILESRPGKVRIDSLPVRPPELESPGRVTLQLPHGRHVVRVESP